MGGSSSTSSVQQDIENHFVNQSDLNIMNKISNKTSINEIIKVVESCSASIFQNQNIVVSGIKSKGNINIQIGQNITSGLAFSCLQQAQVRNQSTQNVSSQIYSQMQQKIQAKIMQILETYAKAQAKNGFLSWADIGGSSSDTNVNTTVKNYIDNKIEINLKNIIQFFTEININSKTVQNCASKVTQDQYITVKNTDSGATTNIAINQNEGAQVFTKCMQSTTFINTIYTNTANGIGIKVVSNVAVEVTTESVTEAISEAISEGIASLFKAIGDLLNSLFQGLWSGPIMIASIIGVVCCVIVILIIGAIFLFRIF